MSTQKVNSQIIRSKRLLRNALIELLSEKPFKKITITDIALKAGYSRTTFYSHYNYIEDILNEYIDELIENILFDSFGGVSSFPPTREEQLKMTQKLVNHWEENAASFRALHTAGLENIITENLKEKMRKFHLENISAMMSPLPDHQLMEYFDILTSQFLVSTLQFWISKDMTTPKEKIAQILSFFDIPKFYIFLQKQDM
jgi:AcrR family transcriptional regulator